MQKQVSASVIYSRKSNRFKLRKVLVEKRWQAGKIVHFKTKRDGGAKATPKKINIISNKLYYYCSLFL